MANERSVTLFCKNVSDEYQRAITQFPSSDVSTVALMEEVGELAKALLHHHREGKPVSIEDIYFEAVQVAVMAARIAIEGDASIRYGMENTK